MSERRSTFNEFRAKALKKPDVRAEYDALGPPFEMKRRMIAMRTKAGLTQEQMAELLGTKKSNISRLESISSEASPRLSTIEQYARALGYSVKVEFEPGRSVKR
jgi:DNA-binding XRE family transcriptional regulator